MNFLKIIMAIIGLFFLAMIGLWLLGAVWSLVGYVFWLAVIGGVIYGAYRLFGGGRKGLGSGNPHDLEAGRDFNMSWEEYERKYLSK